MCMECDLDPVYFTTLWACLYLFGHSYADSANEMKLKCRHLQNSGLSDFTCAVHFNESGSLSLDETLGQNFIIVLF